MLTVTGYRPDATLRAASTRIVLAVGAGSDGELAHRGAVAVAELLGTTPVTFPATTADSSAASTARPVSRRRSRPRCDVVTGRGLTTAT